MTLLLLAAATLISEDLTCLAAGALVARGQLGFAEATAACLAGIFAGDLLLFLAGRLAGLPLLRWPPAARLLPPDRVRRAADWLNERGLTVILLSRFTPGLRLPTYFAAGLLPTRTAAFVVHFLIASLVWTPLLVGAAAYFGGRIGGASLVLIAAALLLLRHARSLPRLLRRFRWEFWPSWAAYLPLLPWLVFLAIRHRSATVFTASNPGILTGGLFGESKASILEGLRPSGAVADFTLLPPGADPRPFVETHGFPLVVKPDVGERGAGVTIVRTAQALEQRLTGAREDLILQRYVEGPEFGVFYVRHPARPHGFIFSITRKTFPVLTGDGRSTVDELILKDRRAATLAATYRRMTPHPLDAVPAAGERLQLVEIGSHCRGSIFLEGGDLATPALEAAIDRVARAHTGFFFGRFDVRSPSVEDFQAGRFTVLELNGVSSEATHIYDPAVSLWEAYRVLCAQWKLAFEIGAANVQRGAAPTTVRELLALRRSHVTARNSISTTKMAPYSSGMRTSDFTSQ